MCLSVSEIAMYCELIIALLGINPWTQHIHKVPVVPLGALDVL